MPFPRPAARPWGGFDAGFKLPWPIRRSKGPGAGSNDDVDGIDRAFRRLVQKAHAAERAAAIAYRGHRCCFRDHGQRRMVQQLAVDEWRHRAWLRRRIMPACGMEPNKLYEMFFILVGGLIALLCLFIGPFFASYFAGRLERDNGSEYDQMAKGLGKVIGVYPATKERFIPILQFMARVERKHERDLLQVVRHHRWLPLMMPIFHWPLRKPGLPAPVEKKTRFRPQRVLAPKLVRPVAC